jgi:hypothetical protein
VLAEHGEAIEADLLRWYHVDILDLGTERLSWRRLNSLIRHLPRDSAFVRAMLDERARWGEAEHLLAAVVDAIQAGNWLLASAHSKHRVQRPKRILRPGERDLDHIGRGRGFTVAELRRRLAESNGPNSPYVFVDSSTV